MSYHLYTTDGFVLDGAPFGEGSKFFTLFTREFGMITASATSVREERSKLRYGLQDFSYSKFTLVRGRDLFRITNATLIENVFTSLREEPEATALFARVARLLRRLVGEEKNEELFSVFTEAVARLKGARGDRATLESIEIILVLRMLYLLGYLSRQKEFGPLLSPPFVWDGAVLSQAAKLRSRALSSINHSLQASQL